MSNKIKLANDITADLTDDDVEDVPNVVMKETKLTLCGMLSKHVMGWTSWTGGKLCQAHHRCLQHITTTHCHRKANSKAQDFAL